MVSQKGVQYLARTAEKQAFSVAPQVAAAASEPEDTDPLWRQYAYVKRDLAALDKLYDRSASRNLGAGANGEVSTVVKRATGETMALKKTPPDEELPPEEALRQLLASVDMQRGASHPNIAHVEDVFYDESTRVLSFTMPLGRGGSVPHYLARHLDFDEACTPGPSCRVLCCPCLL